MIDPVFGVLFVAGAGALVGVLFFGNAARARRRLRKTPVTPIAEAQAGALVRVRGVVEPLDASAAPLIAPLSKRACVYYFAEAISRSRNTPSVLAREEFGTEFLLRDQSGSARILLVRGSNIDAQIDFISRSSMFDDATHEETTFLARHKRSSQGFMGMNLSIQYKERVLALGEHVSVWGVVAKREHDPNAQSQAGHGYRDMAVHTRPVIAAPPQEAMVLSDHVATVVHETK